MCSKIRIFKKHQDKINKNITKKLFHKNTLQNILEGMLEGMPENLHTISIGTVSENLGAIKWSLVKRNYPRY